MVCSHYLAMPVCRTVGWRHHAMLATSSRGPSPSVPGSACPGGIGLEPAEPYRVADVLPLVWRLSDRLCFPDPGSRPALLYAAAGLGLVSRLGLESVSEQIGCAIAGMALGGRSHSNRPGRSAAILSISAFRTHDARIRP